MILLEDLGMRYPLPTSKHKKRFGRYECPECHGLSEIQIANVKNGNQERCNSCARKLAATTHGKAKTPLHARWLSIRNRCNNPNEPSYKDYGAKGIKMCSDWDDFEVFEKWALANGYKPELTIDRLKNDKGYEPSNCRWTTKLVQAQHRGIHSTNTTGYKGVSKYPKGKFRTTIRVKGEHISLGLYDTPEAAALAYNKYVDDNKLEHCKNEII